MAAGHAQPRQCDELLRGLLARAEKEPKNREALETLAVACLETSAKSTRPCRRESGRWPNHCYRQEHPAGRDPIQNRRTATRPPYRTHSPGRPPISGHYPRGQPRRRRRRAEDNRSLRPD